MSFVMQFLNLKKKDRKELIAYFGTGFYINNKYIYCINIYVCIYIKLFVT